MDPVIIQNDNLTATIQPLGAELTSLLDQSGCEYIWQRDPKFWQSSAPVLFPIVGGLKNDQYALDGRIYSLPKHGFASQRVFSVSKQTTSSVQMTLADDEDTRRMYPFSFLLSVDFCLRGHRLITTYTIQNRSERTLYASIGAHEGYMCPEGIESYDLCFEQEETLETCAVDGSLLSGETSLVLEKGFVLPLKTEYFMIDALIFSALHSQSVTLLQRDGGRRIRVDFPGFPSLGVWTRPGAPFVCIEPWCGLPDEVTSSGKIAEKRGIMAIPTGKYLFRTHIITIEN